MADLDLHRYRKAIDDLSRADRISPDNPQLLLPRAMAYEKTGQTRKAIDDYAKVLLLMPQSKEALSGLLRLKGRP